MFIPLAAFDCINLCTRIHFLCKFFVDKTNMSLLQISVLLKPRGMCLGSRYFSQLLVVLKFARPLDSQVGASGFRLRRQSMEALQ